MFFFFLFFFPFYLLSSVELRVKVIPWQGKKSIYLHHEQKICMLAGGTLQICICPCLLLLATSKARVSSTLNKAKKETRYFVCLWRVSVFAMAWCDSWSNKRSVWGQSSSYLRWLQTTKYKKVIPKLGSSYSTAKAQSPLIVSIWILG